MKKALKIIALVVIVSIIVFLVLSYLGIRKNNAQITDLNDDLRKKVEENESAVRVNADLIDANSSLIDSSAGLISANAGLINDVSLFVEEINDSVSSNRQNIGKNLQQISENNKLIVQNSDEITRLQNAQEELRSVTTAHGYKVNRVVKLIFDLAYGANSDEGHKKWYQYTKCANQSLWEEAVGKLSLAHIQKLLEINQITEKIAVIDNQFSQIKPRCFQ